VIIKSIRIFPYLFLELINRIGQQRALSTGNKRAFHRIDGEWFDVLVKAWFSGAKMNNAMSKA
jgi:hypothetical protein